ADEKRSIITGLASLAEKKTAGALGVERGTGGTRIKAGVYATCSRGWDTSSAAVKTQLVLEPLVQLRARRVAQPVPALAEMKLELVELVFHLRAGLARVLA